MDNCRDIHNQLDLENISPVRRNSQSRGRDITCSGFQYDDVDEVDNLYEDNLISYERKQNVNDSNAYLQKVQFQRIDKKVNQQAYFLFVIKFKELDEEEHKINGYETSYTDLINLFRDLQKQYPAFTPDFSEMSSSVKKCIEDGNLIFDNMLYSSDLFQTFLEVNYKYNLNCQSQNTIYTSTVSDNSHQGSSQDKIDEDEQEEEDDPNNLEEDYLINANTNFNHDSPIEAINSQQKLQRNNNLSKSTSPTLRNKTKPLQLFQLQNGKRHSQILNSINVNQSNNTIDSKKKSTSGSEEVQTNQRNTIENIIYNQKDQFFKEDEMIAREYLHQLHSNQLGNNIYFSDQIQEKMSSDYLQDAHFMNDDNLLEKQEKKKKDIDQGYAEEDGDNDDDDDDDEKDNQYKKTVSYDEDDEQSSDHDYNIGVSYDKVINRRNDYQEEDEDDEEEEKTIANDHGNIKYSSKKNENKVNNEYTCLAGSSSMSGGGSGVQEGLEGNQNDSLKQAYPGQCTIEDSRYQITNQYEQNYNQRSSILQNGSVLNYSQFRPQRSSLIGLSQSSFQVLSYDQQSMYSRQFCGSSNNSQTMIKRISPLYQNRKSILNNKLPNYNDQNQIFINNTNLQNFESSISQSRSKKVIKILKDQIEARCHQQLLQAQTLGSISSTNSFDDSPITKMNRKDKKLHQNTNQMQKGGYSQLHIQNQNHHLNGLNPSQHNRQNLIDFRRNSLNIQENAQDELSRNHKSIHRLSILQHSQQGLPTNSPLLQLSLQKSKNYNMVSEVSICGNTVFEADQDAFSVKLINSGVCGEINQTQNTITQNNITEELDDSSESSLNKTQNSNKKKFNAKFNEQVNKIPPKGQRHYSTHQDLDRSQSNKNNKQVNRTNPVIEDEKYAEETKINHIGSSLQNRKFKPAEKFKKMLIIPKNDANSQKENFQEIVQFQDHTELMFKSNNYSLAPDKLDSEIKINNLDTQVNNPKLLKNEKSLSRTRSIDSHNSNNMSNAKVVEEYSAQYDFNSNEKVNVEDVQVGLVSGDLKKTDNKEKICNLLLNKQYSDLSEIGSGSYGLVLRARTPEGYIRALKIHCEKTEIEFKLAKFLSSEGTENLSANNIMTYNTIKFRDTVSKRKIEVIEMELADDSLKNQIYGVKSEISDEKFRQICTQLVVNVLSMHNMCVVHRDLKLDNILVSNGNYFLADFGISEEIGPQLIKKFIPGTDSFSIKQSIAGTQLYFSPIIRDAHSAQPKKYSVDHDPFKSDIYTVGLILLEIELVRQKYTVKQVRQILSDKNQAYEYALKTNINKYLIKDNYYILKNQLFQPVNILAEMLQIDEINRISSVKLCLICQLDKIILSNIIVPHHKIFPPIIEFKQDNNCVIRYTIKLLTYEGSYMKMEDGRILRHGEGQLYKLVEEESVIYKVLVYEGQWDNDLPHGQGTFYFFQNEWVYEGQFRNGQFFGEGVIKFIDWIVYKGDWYNFMLKEFIIPIEPSSSDLYLSQESKNVEVVINTHDKEGSMRNIGMNEVELQFDINTFRLYAMNVIEFKPYLQDKQRVRIVLLSKKTKHDFQSSARQQLLMLAINKKKKRVFEVFIKYFKHEPILDSIILEQLIQLLNHSYYSPMYQNKETQQKQNINHRVNLSSPSSSKKITELISIQDDDNDSETESASDLNTNNDESIKNNKQGITEDSDSIVYLNFDFFSKECTSQFFERSSNDQSLGVLKVDYLKNIGVPQQLEEESLIKLLLSKCVENLKELDLSSSKDVSSSIFVALDHKQNSDSLKMLNLKYEALSQQTFCSLFKYPFLKQIIILDISYSEFDDKCMTEFTQCPFLNSLQRFILCYCRNITYKALDVFIQKVSHDTFPSLTYLDFEGILSKGYQSQNDKKQSKMPSQTSFQNNPNNTDNIHQTEQEMLLAFDRKHHLSSSNSNLTTLHQPLINVQQQQWGCNGGLISGGSTDTFNISNINSQSSTSSIVNASKQNAYIHYFPYTSSDILKQLEYVQKENILRKNLVELNKIGLTSSFSSSCNLPSLPQMYANDELDQSSVNDQFPISENNNISSQSHSKYSNNLIAQNNNNNNNLQTFHSVGTISLTNIGSLQKSSSTINNQNLNISSQSSIKNVSSTTNLSSKTTGTFFNWVSKLTDKNILTLEKFSRQSKLNFLSFLSLKATNIDDSVLKNVAKTNSFQHLKQLDISQCSQITSQGFEYIITSLVLKNLIKLDISQTKISSVTQKKPQQIFFQSLNITDCNNIPFQSICNYFSSKYNSSIIRQIYLDSDKFFVTQVNQVLLECQRLEDIHINISPQKTDFQPNQLTLNLLLEKGYNLNFYSSKLFVESVNDLVKNEIIQTTYIKSEQLNQIFINGIPYINLNRFSAKSANSLLDSIKINKTQILDIPSKDISLEQLNDENIIEDLRKLFNSRNFLLVKELDISRLKVNSYAGQLLAGSRYTRSLAYIDISYSTITDEDLNKLSKSKYLPKLQIIKLNCCKDITEKGINYLLNAQNNLENLKSIEVKQRLLNLYLLFPQCSERVQIIVDSILFKAEQNQLRQVNNNHRVFQFAKYWTKIFRDNMQNINSIEISGFDENIIDYFLTHITDKNRVKKVIIDFSKKNQKMQTQIQNLTQFQRINQIFSKLPDLKELRLDFSRWREMTDQSVKEFSEGIVGLKNLKVLEINLSEWAKDNMQITDFSCMFLRNIFQKILKINVISIDLSHWGEDNTSITDKSITYLSEGIHYTKDYLTYLSLKLNCWGPQITNNSLILLDYLVRDLNLLSFLNLGLQEWGKDNPNINDQGIESLTTAIGNSKYLNQLEINLAYAAHLNSGIGDGSVQNLAKSLMNINSLSSLKINLAWWMVDMNLYGFNTDVSDECIKDLASAIGKLKSLTELDLNFDRWGYKNKFIKDESIINLAENIENLHALNSLSLNFDWWGLGNEKITEKSLIFLGNKLTQLNKLTSLQLFLSLDRWKKIEEKHIQQFKEKIMTLKNFNKNIAIDIK